VLHRVKGSLSSWDRVAAVGQLGDSERERSRINGDRGDTLARLTAKDLDPVRWQERASRGANSVIVRTHDCNPAAASR
jgi:hypothetical protein